jgi:hypothetical protein
MRELHIAHKGELALEKSYEPVVRRTVVVVVAAAAAVVVVTAAVVAAAVVVVAAAAVVVAMAVVVVTGAAVVVVVVVVEVVAAAVVAAAVVEVVTAAAVVNPLIPTGHDIDGQFEHYSSFILFALCVYCSVFPCTCFSLLHYMNLTRQTLPTTRPAINNQSKLVKGTIL